MHFLVFWTFSFRMKTISDKQQHVTLSSRRLTFVCVCTIQSGEVQLFVHYSEVKFDLKANLEAITYFQTETSE